MSNTPTIDSDWKSDGKRRVKCHPKTAPKHSAIDPDVGDVVECEFRVAPGFVIPCELEITGHGDTWNDGKERWSYGEIDWTPAIELFRDEIGGPLPGELEGQVRDRLSGVSKNEGLDEDEIDEIIDALK